MKRVEDVITDRRQHYKKKRKVKRKRAKSSTKSK